MATFPLMSRLAPRRRGGHAALASLLIGALLLAGCGGGSDEEGSGDEGTETTTTAASDETTTTEAAGGASAMLDGFAEALEGSGFDADQQACILEVAERGLTDSLDPAELDAAYQESCELTANEVTAGAYFSALVDLGVDEAAAGCARDLYAGLSPEQAAEVTADEAARASILEGCGIDPALVEQG